MERGKKISNSDILAGRCPFKLLNKFTRGAESIRYSRNTKSGRDCADVGQKISKEKEKANTM